MKIVICGGPRGAVVSVDANTMEHTPEEIANTYKIIKKALEGVN